MRASRTSAGQAGSKVRSACHCAPNSSRLDHSRSLRAALPSTRSSDSGMPLSAFMHDSSSALCSAIDSSVARAMWARVVPRVMPTSVPRA
ncbi:Uncharacterised protein [Bordetella pertussis]|nr:Uncharacterised protein [Bordetella pertussis]